MPFVLFKMQPTEKISAKPTLIVPEQECTCVIDSMHLVNITNIDIRVTLLIKNRIDAAIEQKIVYKPFIDINKYASLYLQESLILQKEHLLYAYSNDVDNIFNAFVSFRVLTELV